MAALPKIAWIGAGRMGVPMAGFILQAGYPVTVYSRSIESRAKLVTRGAREAFSVAECVRDADFIFASVSDDASLADISFGANGVIANAKGDAVFAETSTVSSAISQKVAEDAAKRGLAYLRMPISGNAASAIKGEVTVMASGPEAPWQRIKPVVEKFSKAQVYLGLGEEARHMKLVVNAMVVIMAQGMAEALTLGRKSGLDWNVMLDTLGQSTISSHWLRAKIGLMKPRDFTPTMTSRLILKDIDLMLSAAREANVPMPLTATTRQLMQMVIGEGYGEEDYMALIKLAERQSGITPE